jgi:hypothetical protein
VSRGTAADATARPAQPAVPRALPVLVEAIPAELKAIDTWVVWRYKWKTPAKGKAGKWDKPPLDARTGKPASSTDPKTWTTFASALAAYHRGQFHGIGVALYRAAGESGPALVGIDLDKCRDPQTGELQGWAAQIVRELDSYAEVSPSGRGVRIFVFGELPAGGRRRGQVEMYDSGRYLTVTGHRLGEAPPAIAHRPAALLAIHASVFGGANGMPATPAVDARARADSNGRHTSLPVAANPFRARATEDDLTDKGILRRAQDAENGSKFKSLWSGDWSDYPSQSEADLALCGLLAFWTGPDPDRLDRLFHQSGLMRPKWDSRHGAQTYGQRTIAKALENRTEFYSSGQSTANGKAEDVPGQEAKEEDGFRNFCDGKKGKKTIRIGYPIQHLHARLNDLANGWPRRMNNLLFAEQAGPKPLWLETPAALFAWIAGRLPASDTGNGLVWRTGPDMVSETRFHAYLTQKAEDFDGVELYPHFPPMTRHYYLHPPIQGGDGKALAELLARFSPAGGIDSDLILAFFLSLLWGGPPGARPAWLFTSDDNDPQGGRGVGKTTVAKMGARLVGGHIDLATNERMPDVITRLLSPDALERRVVLLDNVKTLKLSWQELEALITNDSVSGHRLYHGEGRRPNTLTYCLTLNGASLSRDLAQRCIIVQLKRPDYAAGWEKETLALIEGKRWAIIGDILAILRDPPRQVLSSYGRWGAWESEVLARVAEPADCQKVISERQEEVDDDATEAELVRQEFVALLTKKQHSPEHAVVWFDSKTAAFFCNRALSEKRPVNKASTYLRTLSIPELSPNKRPAWGGRGWLWRGRSAPPETHAVRLAVRLVGGSEDEDD